jgi:tRNA(Glu) U13 pseudouridine synthase TruD
MINNQRYMKDNYDSQIIEDFVQYVPIPLSYAPYARLSTNYKIQRNNVNAQDDFLNLGQSQSNDYFSVIQTSQTAVG